ncbi:MAG: hypothetical protein IH825_07575 [Candidatus Marinimicrobia bacterium]|nr:hypothetical protein [Candidatus Neomarinimicrobiota bacterium]
MGTCPFVSLAVRLAVIYLKTVSIPEYFILTAVLVAGFALRMRFRGLPLDWDHGVYGYMNFWYKKMGKNIIPGAGGNESLINWGKPGLTYIFWLVVTLAEQTPAA